MTATRKDIANDRLLIKQREKQLEQRKQLYTWRGYPESGLPSSIDDGILSLPVNEEFHRAKAINFLADTFKGVVLTGDALPVALGVIDDTIRELLGISTNTAFELAHDLHVFEELCLQLLKNQVKNRNPQSEIARGFEMKICQASRWVFDEEFGRQILNGVNPVVIQRCFDIKKQLPDGFNDQHVKDKIAKSSLVRNMTLEEEVKVCKFS